MVVKIAPATIAASIAIHCEPKRHTNVTHRTIKWKANGVSFPKRKTYSNQLTSAKAKCTQ